MQIPFHGSYAPEDVTFLLKPLESVDNLPPIAKERAMQTGERHYSEMLNPEKLPSPQYLALFEKALTDNGEKMAQDCQILASQINTEVKNPILVSLARAGTPVGVVVKHILSQMLSKDVPHYSISIIRDRGIDHRALDYILQKHGGMGENLVFIDGWTGKGVINQELKTAVRIYNAKHHTQILPHLYVLSDLAGVAWKSASYEDYLIPSAILNATVSGLISRSVLNQQIGENDFHGCLFYHHFLPADQSRIFVKTLLALTQQAFPPVSVVIDAEKKSQQREKMTQFMTLECQRYGITDLNLIKPGIGEATRVLLRRLPERVIVQNADQPDIHHLLVLAKEKNVPLEIRPELPFKAVSIIRSALH